MKIYSFSSLLAGGAAGGRRVTVYHRVLSVTPCSTGENLIYDWHVGCPENHLWERQMTCGPWVLPQEGFAAGSEASRPVVMATFTLPWGGYSTALLAAVDPLAVSLQPILITTSLRQGRAQQGTASCCKKTDLLSPIWSLSHHSVEKE